MNRNLTAPAIAGRRIATVFFSLIVAVSLPIWAPVAFIKSMFHSTAADYAMDNDAPKDPLLTDDRFDAPQWVDLLSHRNGDGGDRPESTVTRLTKRL